MLLQMHIPADIDMCSKHGSNSTACSESGVGVGLSQLFSQCGAVIQRVLVTTNELHLTKGRRKRKGKKTYRVEERVAFLPIFNRSKLGSKVLTNRKRQKLRLLL